MGSELSLEQAVDAVRHGDRHAVLRLRLYHLYPPDGVPEPAAAEAARCHDVNHAFAAIGLRVCITQVVPQRAVVGKRTGEQVERWTAVYHFITIRIERREWRRWRWQVRWRRLQQWQRRQRWRWFAFLP